MALLKSLTRSMVMHGGIETTIAKAKELRPHVERLVTMAKKNTLASRRIVASRTGNDLETVAKLHDVIGPRYATRPGGYTRITKLGGAANVAHDTAFIEFV